MSLSAYKTFKPTAHAKVGMSSITAHKSGFERQTPAVRAPQAPAPASDVQNQTKKTALLDRISQVQKTLDLVANDTLTNKVTLPAGQAGMVMAKNVQLKISATTAQLKSASIGIDSVEIRRAVDFLGQMPTRIWAKLDGLQNLITSLRSQSHTVNYVIGRFMEEVSSLEQLLSQALTQVGEIMSSLYNWTKTQLRKVRLSSKVEAALEAAETGASWFAKLMPKLWHVVSKITGPVGIIIDMVQAGQRFDTYNDAPTDEHYDKLVIECLGIVVDFVIYVVPILCGIFMTATMPAWIGWAILAYTIVNVIYFFAATDSQDLLATLVYRLVQSIVNLLKWAYHQVVSLAQQFGVWAADVYGRVKAKVHAWLVAQEEAALNWAKRQGQAAVDGVENAAKDAWKRLQFPLPTI